MYVDTVLRNAQDSHSNAYISGMGSTVRVFISSLQITRERKRKFKIYIAIIRHPFETLYAAFGICALFVI
jgi:hypothetical protein